MTADEHPCSEVAALASAVLDGELDGDRWAELQRHLVACAACAEYLRQLELTVEAVRKLPGGCDQATRAALLVTYRSWISGRT